MPFDFKIAGATLLCLLACGLSAQAQTSDADSYPPPVNLSQQDFDGEALRDQPTFRQTLMAGVNLHYFDYLEKSAPPNRSSEKGALPGIDLSYEVQPYRGAWFVKINSTLTRASTQYDGTSFSLDQSGPVKPTTGTTSNRFIDARIVGGGQLGEFAPYAGIGRTLWSRGNGEVVNGVISFPEDYSWFYAPVGIRWRHELGSSWRIGADASVQIMFGGQIEVDLSKRYVASSDGKGNLGSMLGYRAEVPLEYMVWHGLGIALAPWFQYSAIGESPAFALTVGGQDGMFVEPESRTFQYGASLAAAAHF